MIKRVCFIVIIWTSAVFSALAGGSYNRYVAPCEAVPYPTGSGTVYVKSAKGKSLGGVALQPKYKDIGADKGWSMATSSFKGNFEAYVVEKQGWFFIGWTKDNPWSNGSTFISTEKGSANAVVTLISNNVTSYGLNVTSGTWNDGVQGKECIQWMNDNKENCTFCYGNFARVKASTASNTADVSCNPIVNEDGTNVTLTATAGGDDEVFSHWELNGQQVSTANPYTFQISESSRGEYYAVFVNLTYPESGTYVCKNAGTSKYVSYGTNYLEPSANREEDYCAKFTANISAETITSLVSDSDDDIYSYRSALISFANEVLQELNVTADVTSFINSASTLRLEPVAGGYHLYHAIPALTCGKTWTEITDVVNTLLETTDNLNSLQKSFVAKLLADGVEPGNTYYLTASSDGSAIHYTTDASTNYTLWNFYAHEDKNYGNTNGWARLRNVGTGNYATFVGNIFQAGNPPNFEGIAKMESLDAAYTDPGSIFWVRNQTTQSDIYSQGFGLRFNTDEWPWITQISDDNSAWILFFINENYRAYLKDGGNGNLTGVTSGDAQTTHWSLEPITAATMDKYYFGAKCGAKFTDGEKYYTTMYTYFPYQCMDGVKAYYAKEVEMTGDGIGSVVCQEITSGKVPANTAVILECNGLTSKENRLVPLTCNYNSMNGSFTCTDSSVKPFTDNLLIGTYFNHFSTLGGNRIEYDPEQHLAFSISDGKLGFYRLDTSGGKRYLTPAKAYLDKTKLSDASANGFTLTFVSGEEDGIEQVKPAVRMIPVGVYDLQGRKVADSLDDNLSLPKGIYIVNGRKVVVK